MWQVLGALSMKIATAGEPELAWIIYEEHTKKGSKGANTLWNISTYFFAKTQNKPELLSCGHPKYETLIQEFPMFRRVPCKQNMLASLHTKGFAHNTQEHQQHCTNVIDIQSRRTHIKTMPAPCTSTCHGPGMWQHNRSSLTIWRSERQHIHS